MKKLGSIFLALALALGCMSMTVGAEGPNLPRTDLIFDGTKVATVTYLPPDYSVSAEVTSEIQAAFSYDAGTLMLNKPLSVMGIALEPAVTTLVLNADLTLTGNADAQADAFFTSSTLTLTGSGSLTLQPPSSGMVIRGTFTLNSGSVTTQGDEGGLFVFAPTTPDVVTRAATPAADFVMNGGYLKAICNDGTGDNPAISVKGGIKLNGVAISLPEGGKIGEVPPSMQGIVDSNGTPAPIVVLGGSVGTESGPVMEQIVATHNEGGKITLEDEKGKTILAGENWFERGRIDKTYTVLPEAGYTVKSVLVDGKPVTLTAESGYVFELIYGKRTIDVTFEKGADPVVTGAVNPVMGARA